MFRTTHFRLGFAVLALGVTMLLAPAQSRAGGGSGVDTIKVSKCEYAVTSGGGYVELLVAAASSNPNAFLVAFLPDGTPLGQVHNGFGGKYGGTVFLSMYIPATITIVSSSGGHITVPCVPFQP